MTFELDQEALRGSTDKYQEKMSINKMLLGGSIFAVVFFSILVVDSFQLLSIPNWFQIFGELLTIPLLLFIVFSLFVSGYKIIKKDYDFTVLVTFGLSFLIVAMLTITTIIQLQ